MIKKTNYFNNLNNSSREIFIEENYFNNSIKFILLNIKGIIDTYNSNEFMTTVMNFCKMRERRVLVLDIKEINYMSSTGIGSLIQINRFCLNNNIRLYIMGLRKNIDEVLSLLGFKSYFNYIQELKDIKEEKIKRSKFPYKFKCPHCGAFLEVEKTGKTICTQCNKPTRIIEDNDKINIIMNIL